MVNAGGIDHLARAVVVRAVQHNAGQRNMLVEQSLCGAFLNALNLNFRVDGVNSGADEPPTAQNFSS